MGTVVNFLAVLVGSTVGLILGDRLAVRTRETVMQGLGLMTLVIGLQMALKTRNMLIPLFALLIGGVLGEAGQIDGRLNRLGHRLEATLAARGAAESSERSVSRGFVASTLLFCIGPVAILGAIQDGLLGDARLLLIKSVLDGFASMAFAASLGFGVPFSAFSVLIYQGAITLAAHALGMRLGALHADAPAIVELTATGGVIIMGLGLNLLELKAIRVANFLPAILLAPSLVALQAVLGL